MPSQQPAQSSKQFCKCWNRLLMLQVSKGLERKGAKLHQLQANEQAKLDRAEERMEAQAAAKRKRQEEKQAARAELKRSASQPSVCTPHKAVHWGNTPSKEHSAWRTLGCGVVQ